MLVGLVTLVTLFATGTAWGQGFARPGTVPFQRPVLSPYLNLARGGNTAINYYGLVRPQIDFTNSISALEQQVQSSQAAGIGGEGESAALVTGHSTRFFNYSHYFFNQGGTTASAAGAVTAPGIGPRAPGPINSPRPSNSPRPNR
jgi:hypothetical protein